MRRPERAPKPAHRATHWGPITQGAFSGIDWSAAGALHKADPYLVWADAMGDASPGSAPQRLGLLIELADGVSALDLQRAAGQQHLQMAPVYLGTALPAGFRYCTAEASAALVRAIHGQAAPNAPTATNTPTGLRAAAAMVQRAELGMAVQGGVSPLVALQRPHHPHAPPTATLRLHGSVAGFIDDGFAVAHAGLLDAQGLPRVAALWDQGGQAAGPVPTDMRYGSEIDAALIAAARAAHVHHGLPDEDAAYRQLGLSTLHRRPAPVARNRGHTAPHEATHAFRDLDLLASHGTQVMALGSMGHAHPLLAVQLAPSTVQDTSGGAMNARILDAIAWMVARCADDATLGINLSFGTLAGAHDGSSVLECAIDQLLALRPRTRVFIAAGNGYQARMHANGVLPGGAGRRPTPGHTLRWRVPPDDATPSFLELWLPRDAPPVQVTVQPPGRAACGTVTLGAATAPALALRDAQGRTVCALVPTLQPATSSTSACVLLALAPTRALQPGDDATASRATASHGVWQVSLRNTGTQPVAFDAWIERDDAPPGATHIGHGNGARPSHLEDNPAWPAEQQYDVDAWLDDPRRATPIRRSGSFNSIATGKHSVAVGGLRAQHQHPHAATAHGSPPLVDGDAARVRRPGVQRVPDTVAISDDHPLQAGIGTLGTRSGGATRLAGTSAAAPQAMAHWLRRCTPATDRDRT